MANRYVAFADWEVTALRAGTKSVFRRPVFPRAHSAELSRVTLKAATVSIEQRGHSLRATFRTPEGKLWEAWAPHDLQTPIAVREQWAQGPNGIIYRNGYQHEGVGPRPRWRPANAMAIAQARYTLIIADARIERLHDITDEVAQKYEGVTLEGETYRSEFAALWEGTHHKVHPWEANDLVWVFSFVATRVYSPPR